MEARPGPERSAGSGGEGRARTGSLMSDTTSGDAPARPGGPGGPAVPEPVPGLLQETECLRLISTGGIGRLAYSRPDGLAVLPVNYDRLPGLRIGCARSPTSSSP